jgi:hypothetical protein
MGISVTDHALMRFIERVGGVDLTSFRAHISELIRGAMDAGATQVKIDGFSYVIDPVTRTVITIMDDSEHWIDPKAKPRLLMDRDAIQARRRRKIGAK